MIDAGGSTLPITTFNTGDEFDASAFAPQSLLGIDVEYLYVFDPTARINAEAYEDIPVPERPQQFWPRFTLVMADSSDASYGHFASGGVVLPSARNQPQRLVGANFSGMYTDKRLELGSRYIYHPLQVVVGAVSHVIYDARSKAAAVQVFSRINRIDVLTPGVAERKRRSVFELGRKAVGEGA